MLDLAEFVVGLAEFVLDIAEFVLAIAVVVFDIAQFVFAMVVGEAVGSAQLAR